MDTTKMKTSGSLLVFKHAPTTMLRLILSKEHCIEVYAGRLSSEIKIRPNNVFTIAAWTQVK